MFLRKIRTPLALTMIGVLGMHGCGSNNIDVVAKSEMSVTPENWPKIESAVPKDEAIEARVADILAKMTVEEKVGQMIQAEIGAVTPADVQKYHLGSVLNGGGSFPSKNKYATPQDWVALADAFYAASTDTSDGFLGIPIIWGSDAVHGHNNVLGATIYPHNIGLGAARDPELMREIAKATAKEVAVTGLDWTFAPTLAVVRDDRWGRAYEGYAESPEIVESYAAPVVEGVQGIYGEPSFMDKAHLLANAKHFLGDGGTDAGIDQGNNLDSEKALRDIHGPGYFSALEAGAQIVMASFSSWQGIKMHANKGLLTNVLKDQMGLDGFVVSDWNAHAQVPGCNLKSCPESIIAGIDMIMVPEDWKGFYKKTVAQVKDGVIPMARIDDAVTRILRVKARAGVLDAPRPSARPLSGKTEFLGSAEHRAIAREAVRKSLVLLKNNDQLLPIDPRKKILVLGDGADNIGKQCGGWTLSWQGTGNTNSDFPNGVSIYQSLADQVKKAGGEISLVEGGKLDISEKPDVAIVVFGEDPYAEFQGDRKTLIYRERKNETLKQLEALNALNIPVVSVFLSGRPMWVNPYLNKSQAFVAAFLPGSEGSGVADVLLTDANGKQQYDFVGRLSFSWPKSTTQFRLNHDEKPYDPLFAYGYGLSYSDSTSLALLSEEVDAQVAETDEGEILYSRGRNYVPWSISIAELGEEKVNITGMETSTANNKVNAKLSDRNRQGDSLTIVANDAVKFAFGTAEGFDLTNKDYTLQIELRFDQKPTGKVVFSLGCGENCGAELDITDKVAAIPQGKWRELRIPLSCLGDGVSLDNVENVAIQTESATSFVLYDVRFESAEKQESCSGE